MTPAHATSASSNISPEHNSPETSGSLPPAAGWSPAILDLAEAIAGPELREQAMEVEDRVPVVFRVSRAEEGELL